MTYTNKTQPTSMTPENFLEENFPRNSQLRKEALALVDFYTKVTGSTCVMWNKLFGFGKYQYFDSKESIEGIDLKILEPVVKRSLADMKKSYRTEK